MSLEDAINQNTEALKSLALIMAGLNQNQPSTAVEVKASQEKKQTKGGASKTTDSPAETETNAAGSPAKDAGAAGTTESGTDKPEEAAKTVTYDDVKAAVTAVVKAKGRDAGLKVLGEFGTDSAQKLTEAQWPAVIAACDEVLKEG